jgi:hypothetical protein
MARLSVSFVVPVAHEVVQLYFSPAIDHWVGNYQNQTSGFAKALILGNAVNQFQQGHGFMGALGIGLAKGQGVRHPTPTTCEVLIPASATSYGGEMKVAAVPDGDSSTRISIGGRTQGLIGGKLAENVHGLRDYLARALPECQRQHAERPGLPQNSNSIASEIERLAELHKKGLINEREFADAKKKILS